MEKSSKIYIAGHRGMVGSAIMRKLQAEGYQNLVTRTQKELDLLDQSATDTFLRDERPEYVFLAAAKVGGILANNTYRAQFIYENIQIQNNVIHASWKYKVKKLLFLGSSCIYPKLAAQPIKEDYLLTGKLEHTNEPYAIAKITGIKMCQAYNDQYGTNFISVMPTNLYGPNDNFNLATSHVLAALIRKMHLGKCLWQEDWDALRADLDKRPVDGVDGSAGKERILEVLGKYGIKQSAVGSRQSAVSSRQSAGGSGQGAVVTLWGSGSPRREFLHVGDLADACYFLMQNYYSSEFLNIGTGKDLTIKELSELIADIEGFYGEIRWDTGKPDGTPRKLLDVSRLTGLGWTPKTSLKEGLERTYGWYLGGEEEKEV